MTPESADTPRRRSEKDRHAKLHLVAGLLTLAGPALDYALHPMFYALPAAAGTALVVSEFLDRPADP